MAGAARKDGLTALNGVWSTPGFTAKAPHMNRALYANVSTEPATTPARTTVPQGPYAGSPAKWTNASSTDSLATKPPSSGTPAMDAAPIPATTARAREDRKTPESLRMSRVPAWWSMMPTTRNSVALKSPWASSMASPASAASGFPSPTTMVRKPSWLTVP